MNTFKPDKNPYGLIIWKGLLILWYLLVFPCIAYCDYINLSGAQNAPNLTKIHINDNHIKIRFEINIHDISIFHHLLPDNFFKERDLEIPSLKKRMQIFSKNTFQVVTGKGKKLIPTLVIGEFHLRTAQPSQSSGTMNSSTRQDIPRSPDHNQFYYAELIYSFKEKPQTLTFIPPMDEKTGRVAATIGFATFHKETVITNFHYLYRPAIIRLNWEDPWYSQYHNKAFKRKTTSGAKSFIYIEPFEVRHEILVRVKDLKSWMDLNLEGNDYIEPHENEVLQKKTGQFFLDKQNLLIDGQKRRPILDRTASVKYTMNGLKFLEQPERLPVDSTWIGVIITYLTKGIPQKVETPWNLWSERVIKVSTHTIDPENSFSSFVTPEANVHVWENHLDTYKLPTIEQVMVSDRLQTFKFSATSLICLSLVLPFTWIAIRKRKKGRQTLIYLVLILSLIIGSVVLLPHTAVSIPRPGFSLPKMTSEETGLILHSLLKNIYRSFDFREEEDVYDKLATCVSGDILTDIYLQNRKSFEVKQAGGAQAKVKKVEILEVETIPSRGYFEKQLQVKAKWSASGSVGHWGHIHTRKNQYDALITMKPIDGIWKIIDLDLMEEKRVDLNTAKK